MQFIATDVECVRHTDTQDSSSARVSVCVLDTRMFYAKSAESIKMPFGG